MVMITITITIMMVTETSEADTITETIRPTTTGTSILITDSTVLIISKAMTVALIAVETTGTSTIDILMMAILMVVIIADSIIISTTEVVTTSTEETISIITEISMIKALEIKTSSNNNSNRDRSNNNSIMRTEVVTSSPIEETTLTKEATEVLMTEAASNREGAQTLAMTTSITEMKIRVASTSLTGTILTMQTRTRRMLIRRRTLDWVLIASVSAISLPVRLISILRASTPCKVVETVIWDNREAATILTVTLACKAPIREILIDQRAQPKTLSSLQAT